MRREGRAISVTWDYTRHADAYEGRPPYARAAVDALRAIAGLSSGDRVCDIGAGTGHLTRELIDFGSVVDAVEPNPAMRRLGVERTAGERVRWFDRTGEDTCLPSGAYRVVTFGSSLNVLDRRAALGEARRLLAPDGWFAALWNHRDLMDPLQRTIDQVIRAHVPGYDPGSRRSDHRDVIRASGVFDEALMIEVRVVHTVDRRLWARAWRSHATLAGQAGDRFEAVVADIEDVLRNEPDRITVPYHTRVFVAQARGDHG